MFNSTQTSIGFASAELGIDESCMNFLFLLASTLFVQLMFRCVSEILFYLFTPRFPLTMLLLRSLKRKKKCIRIWLTSGDKKKKIRKFVCTYSCVLCICCCRFVRAKDHRVASDKFFFSLCLSKRRPIWMRG